LFNIYLTIKYRTSLLIILFILSVLFQIKLYAQPQKTALFERFITNESQSVHQKILQDQFTYYTNDSSFKINFYHLTLQPSLDTNFLSGHIIYQAQSNVDDLESIKMDLASDFTIIEMTNIEWMQQEDRFITLGLKEKVQKGDYFTFELSYQGYPALLNDIKGLNFKLEDENQPLIVSLSTPYLGHQWWPCKDGPENKADSVYVDIIIPDTIIQNKQLVGVSNGRLESVEKITNENGNFSIFKWRHNYPIPPYYIMMAVSNYIQIDQAYDSPEFQDFPLEYFVFEEHQEDALAGTAQIPEVMAFFESTFGPYPFNKEKYGMTQLGFYGGIENQTNTVINKMSEGYFMVSVHELAHMWFGDKITCSSWHDAWLNEGFASYAECLWIEHTQGTQAYQNYLNGKKYFGDGTIRLNDIDDPFNIFITIIYNKGAWFLHMLRKVMGDTAFFDALYNYSNNEIWAYGNVDFEDFQFICEQESGTDLDPFFQQWLNGRYYPIYKYNFEQDETLLLRLYIKQDQTLDLNIETVFNMPVDILFQFENGKDSLISIQNVHSYQFYEFNFDQKVQNLILDPDDWILCKKKLDTAVETSNQKLKLPHIFPNPMAQSDILFLSCQFEPSSIQLINQNGNLVNELSFQQLSAAEHLFQLHIPHNITSGIFTLWLSSENGKTFNLPLLIMPK